MRRGNEISKVNNSVLNDEIVLNVNADEKILVIPLLTN